jgi:transcriptional regulator with XRE-family HTH domain
MTNDPNLGDRIRARRAALGLTLAQVADRAALSIPYVSNLERGRGNPTIDAIRAISSALQVPLHELLAGENSDVAPDPLEMVLATAPKSLSAFARSQKFASALQRLAEEQHTSIDEMRRRLLIGMASAPRRGAGDPTEDDWRRLLDVYSLILTEE